MVISRSYGVKIGPSHLELDLAGYVDIKQMDFAVNGYEFTWSNIPAAFFQVARCVSDRLGCKQCRCCKPSGLPHLSLVSILKNQEMYKLASSKVMFKIHTPDDPRLYFFSNRR